LISIIEHLT